MKRKIIRSFLPFVVFYAAAPSIIFSASQTNVMISPPPLPWFEFEKQQWDLRLGGNYTNVSGQDASTKKEVAITGGGVNIVGRYAFTDILALDVGYYFIGIAGGVPTQFDLALFINTWNPNLEIQVVRNDKISWIFFAGAIWSLTPGSLTTYSGTKSSSNGFNIYLTGPQFGTQLGIKASDFAISPFVLIQSLSGNYTVNYPASTGLVDAFTMTSFGVDVTYIPWSITLSSVINQVSASTQNTGYDTLYLALSYDFRWGVAPKGSPNIVPVETAPPPKSGTRSAKPAIR